MDRERGIMNRTELIEYISENAELTKASATRVLEVVLEGVRVSLRKGDPVVLPNFGAFTVKTRAAREGRNPSTGEKIKIGAARVVGFKAGKALKESVNQKDSAKEEISA